MGFNPHLQSSKPGLPFSNLELAALPLCCAAGHSKVGCRKALCRSWKGQTGLTQPHLLQADRLGMLPETRDRTAPRPQALSAASACRRKLKNNGTVSGFLMT